MWPHQPEAKMRTKTGIGLVEVLIAIPILLVLMFLGANRLNHARLAAHRAEVPASVEGIKMAQIAYKASYGRYIEQSSWTPSSQVSKTARSWSYGTNFDTLGWAPQTAKLKGRYKVTSMSTTDFMVTGECDVDDNDENASFTATKSIRVKMNTSNDVY